MHSSFALLFLLVSSNTGVPIMKTCLSPDAFPLSPEFQEYAFQFHKRYSDEEWELHYHAFEENYNLIRNETQQQSTYVLELNRFADMGLHDMEKKYFGVRVPDTGMITTRSRTQHPLFGDVIASRIVDWVQAGVVTPVKDQGACASCWAFAATGALEGACKIASNVLVSLSEQELINGTYGMGANVGCEGGWMFTAFEYVEETGLSTEESVPYTSYNGTGDGPELILSDNSVKGIQDHIVTGYVWVTRTASSLMSALVLQPVSAAIEVSSMSFVLYSSGVLTQPACRESVNHAVLVTGYNLVHNDPFWSIKNSWGLEWGEGGYIKLAMDKRKMYDACGIAGFAFYPLLN